MKQFTMSQYPSREYLLESKSEYYQAICERLLHHLINTGDVKYSTLYDQYFWAANGGDVDEGL